MAPVPNGLCPSAEPASAYMQVQELRDELYCWGMSSAAAVASIAQSLPRPADRRIEIELPLRTLAKLAGEDVVRRLDGALTRAVAGACVERDEQIRAALSAVLAGRVLPEVAILQIEMELALARPWNGTAAEVLSPEIIGRALQLLGIRERGGVSRRSRLFGRICRSIALDGKALTKSFGLSGVAKADWTSLTFCREGICRSCRYGSVCETVAPGLRDDKARRTEMAKA